MVKCYTAGNIFQVWWILRESFEQVGDRGFAFTDEHAINGAARVLQDFFGNKRNTVSTNADECFRRHCTCSTSEVDDFRNVSEVIDRERDDVRSPVFDQVEKVLVRFALQINQTNFVTCASCRCSNEFKAERFEPEINLRVHQAAGMNREEFHLLDPLFLSRDLRCPGVY